MILKLKTTYIIIFNSILLYYITSIYCEQIINSERLKLDKHNRYHI